MAFGIEYNIEPQLVITHPIAYSSSDEVAGHRPGPSVNLAANRVRIFSCMSWVLACNLHGESSPYGVQIISQDKSASAHEWAEPWRTAFL